LAEETKRDDAEVFFCHGVGIVLASRLFGGHNHNMALSIIYASDECSEVRDESSGSTTFFPRKQSPRAICATKQRS
jgi:hypothetical protein